LAFGGAGALAFSAMAAIFATLAPGCTVLTNDALPDDAGPYEGGADASSTACTSCVANQCLGTWAVCLTDPGCEALRRCNNPFTESQAARAACFCGGVDGGAAGDAGGGVDPLAAYSAFAACNDVKTCGSCLADCSATCAKGVPSTAPGCASTDAGTDANNTSDAGAADASDLDAGDASDGGAVAPPVQGVDACASCVAGSCGDAKKLCGLGSECEAFLACAFGCTDASCVDACGSSHSSGKASAMALSSCTLTSCRSACGL
jgi:hypothetical protein